MTWMIEYLHRQFLCKKKKRINVPILFWKEKHSTKRMCAVSHSPTKKTVVPLSSFYIIYNRMADFWLPGCELHFPAIPANMVIDEGCWELFFSYCIFMFCIVVLLKYPRNQSI
uniref:Uncharacterized protein n=1 Tax=Micrurus spixii TaxID=129469 RepID=A0A2D4NBJ7_9SAUR